MSVLATTEMAAYCFHVVHARLTGQPLPPVPNSIPNDPSPIFVTFKTLPHDDLRGCIGNFSPSPLHKQLEDYAQIAAFEDTRFSPITLKELPKLACSVSLLHSFEPCKSWDDWVIGTHGIRFRYQNSYGATYLPSVAAEQGWDHIQTMKSLLVKGGYRGKVDDKVLSALEVTRYQVSLASVNYTDVKLVKPSLVGEGMLPDVVNAFDRPPEERLTVRGKTLHRRKGKQTTLLKVDESKQDDWLDRARQGLHCSLFCGGSKCKHELWESMKVSEQREAAIEGLNSNWVGKNVIASQRPSTSLFLKYPLVEQFRTKHVTGVLNLQEKGEHGSCGPDGIYESCGYSYNGAEDLMPHGIAYYEFPWPDMTAPQQDVVLRSVQVMDYHVKMKGNVLVHCHAGLGRTGLMIACYYVYSQHMPSADAIEKVRECRPGAIQTARQAQFIADFEKHLWRLTQAFRVEISDALIDVDLFMQRQRLVLHGEQSDLYKNVPMFLHVILCRLLNLTRGDEDASRLALESLGPSSAPDDATLSACRIAINRRRFRMQSIYDVSILSFLVCDWFRSMSAPVLSFEDCDKIVAYKLSPSDTPDSLAAEIRKIMSKPVRHTLGMVTSVFYVISEAVSGESVKRFAFRCLVDSFNHAFNPIKVRHSPTERELINTFFVEWGSSVKDMYFNYDAVPPAHRTIKRVAMASSIVLEGTKVDRRPGPRVASPTRSRRVRGSTPPRPATAPHIPTNPLSNDNLPSSPTDNKAVHHKKHWALFKRRRKNSSRSGYY